MTRMITIPALVAVGCGRIGFAPIGQDATQIGQDATTDATSGLVDAATPFGAPVLIPELTLAGANSDDPWLSSDQLELYLVVNFGGASEIRRSTRATTTDSWSAPASIPELTVANDYSPRLTSDGLAMYFGSLSTGGGDVYFMQRPDRASAWGTQILVPELSTAALDGGPATDAAELHLIMDVTGTDKNLFVSERASIADAWSTPVLAPELATPMDDVVPWLDAAGVTIYFASDRAGGLGGRDIYTARRPSTTASFVMIEPVQGGVGSSFDDSDPWVSPDGSTIYFSSKRSGKSEIYMATR